MSHLGWTIIIYFKKKKPVRVIIKILDVNTGMYLLQALGDLIYTDDKLVLYVKKCGQKYYFGYDEVCFNLTTF